MTKNRRKGGFTLAEMLIVVAIVIVLMGVAFVAVQNYQSSSTRLEFDTIAKEIFVAAQNHLTEAESQGLLDALGENKLGAEGTLTEDTIDGKQEVYYILNDGIYDEALNLLLPNYAVDATVLAGSYIIRYQPSSGTVLDVFYSRPGNPTFLTKSGTELGADDYTYESLMNDCKGDDKRSARERFGSKNAVIGWYGGGEPIPKGERLRAPTFEVYNEETLWVKVTDPNTNPPEGYLIKLIVIGKSSEAEKYFDLINEKSDDGRVTDSYKITLDDITQKDMHFADLDANTAKKFIPGEDLEIKVVAYSKSTLANVAMSATKTTNSLFADPKSVMKNGSDVDNGLASIANIRHLENLDAAVSKLEDSDDFAVTKANQIEDLSWTDFMAKTGKENTVVYSGATPTEKGCYYPVSPDHAIEYDGQNHSVLNLQVQHTGNAGMFGTLEGSSIKNVIVRNEVESGTDASLEIKGDGYAGGLVGYMKDGSVTNCAAAVYVNGGDAAGGLIGKAESGVTVSGCYAGGHTKDGKYLSATTAGDEARMNVIATGVAGGLIGDAGNTTISNSYSTCSVKATDTTGGTAGGFVGAGGGSISGSYCTGLVSGATEGAFAGTAETGFSATNCKYFEIINEIKKDDDGNEIDGYNYLKPLGNKTREVTETNFNIKPFDADADSYDSFVGDPDEWQDAKPYDATLTTYYKDKYDLQTVKQLGASVEDTDLVATHYGDWPAPEEFVFN